jgi:hypothetical protein
MCGIVGIINASGRYQTDVPRAFKELLYVDVVRGPHSTGVFKVEKNKVDWRKAACDASEFFQLKGVGGFLQGIGDVPFLVGHNRWATKGEVVNKNAHPFEEGHITLVHNGTLWGHRKLPDGEKFVVDSQAIAHAIRKIGIEKTVPLLDGAYALVWYNAKEKTLNLLRNKDRPLYVLHAADASWVKEDNMIFLGSEIEMLKWIASRNKFYGHEWRLLPEHEVWSFREGNMEPRITKVEPYKTLFQGWQGQHQARYPGVYGGMEDDSFGDVPHVFSSVTRPTGAVNPVATAALLAFQKETEAKMNEPAPEGQPLIKIGVGENILFGIDDFEDKLKQGGFVPVVGTIPFNEKTFVIKGNYSGDLEILLATKKLFTGEVTNVKHLKSNKILIEVRGIKVSDIPDPFFLSLAEKEEWKKTNGRKEEEKVVQVETKKPQEEQQPIILQGQNSTRPCHKCGKPTPISGPGNGISVFKSGGARWSCMPCYREFDPAQLVNVARQEHGRTIN